MNQSAIEIISDEIYAEAYKKAENAFNKKYDKLLTASTRFMNDYNSTFGQPDEWEIYFDLEKIVKKSPLYNQ